MLNLRIFRPRTSKPNALTEFFSEFSQYLHFLYNYSRIRGYRWFAKFEVAKDVVVDLLYKRRGKYARPFLHFGTIALAFAVITFGPILVRQEHPQENPSAQNTGILTSVFAYGSNLSTAESPEVQQFRSGEITTHVVQDGETLSSIAQKYGLESVNTIIWENDLDANQPLKPGQELRILPIDGIRHKVERGETIYSIAKKFGLGSEQAAAEPIANYPWNEFKNDETYELAVGQTIMIPGGVKPDETQPEQSPPPQVVVQRPTITPAIGAGATGSFIWPTNGVITQKFSFFHPGFDIANHIGTTIVAADSGVVQVAGWIDNSGYGNQIVIDHGNGFITRYAHLSYIQVKPGEHVTRGSVIGQMGSTGHSTGPHLHFEIRRGSGVSGVPQNPGGYLK